MPTTEYDKTIQEMVAKYEAQLRESFPRVVRGVIEDERSGSFSTTLQVDPKLKQGEVVGWKATFKPRERVPLETTEWELKRDQENQLLLTFA